MMSNSHTYRYFHENRRPRLLFEYEGRYFEGTMLGFREDGFRVLADGLAPMEADCELTSVQLLGGESVHTLSRLTVIHVQEQASSRIFDVSAADGAALQKLRDVMHRRFLGHSPQESGSDGFALPSFIGRKHYSAEATEARLDWLERFTGKKLSYVTQSMFHAHPAALAGNIENYIGSVQIPVGLAGPLLVNGTYASGSFAIPIATTEGALISSISRGAKACNAAGGIHAHVVKQTMLRAPVFFCGSMAGALSLARWIEEHEPEIRAKAQSVSSSAKLVRLQAHPFADTLHVQFSYETGDAAGQNMTTSCTYIACEWIAEKVKEQAEVQYIRYMIEGNMAGDKKLNMRSFTEGRGIQVIASVHIPEHVFRQTLRISSEAYLRCWHAAEVGGLRTGMVGHNVNFANVIAGIFAATGQDIACVHESGGGIFKPRPEPDGISFHLQLPSLVIGTIGGGTALPTQRECLEIMGCYGQGHAFKLAEIIASACLALDISTSCAIGSNEFVKAHERLGRKSAQAGIAKSDITNRFFQTLLGKDRGQVKSFEPCPLRADSSIVTNMLKKQARHFQGLHRYRLRLEHEAGERELPVVLKLKADDREMMELGVGIAKLSGDDRLSGLFESQMHIFGFDHAHTREIALYEQAAPSLLRYCPDLYGTMCDEQKQAFAILMEDLSACSHLNALPPAEAWDEAHIRLVLHDLAGMHVVYFDRPEAVPPALQAAPLAAEPYRESTELLLALTAYNYERFPEFISPQLYRILRDFIGQLPRSIKRMGQYHQTLTHNDFNPRNIGIRVQGADKRLVVYDWELARLQNPQHDCMEFLLYALPADASAELWDRCIEYYRQQLELACGVALDRRDFTELALLNALELAAVRFNLYLLAHNLLQFPYMQTIYRNLSFYIIDKYERCGGMTALLATEV